MGISSSTCVVRGWRIGRCNAVRLCEAGIMVSWNRRTRGASRSAAGLHLDVGDSS
jgi:hypothetical protein